MAIIGKPRRGLVSAVVVIAACCNVCQGLLRSAHTLMRVCIMPRTSMVLATTAADAAAGVGFCYSDRGRSSIPIITDREHLEKNICASAQKGSFCSLQTWTILVVSSPQGPLVLVNNVTTIRNLSSTNIPDSTYGTYTARTTMPTQ